MAPTNVITVIKVGGRVIDQEAERKIFLSRLVSLPGAKILVHGGGIQADRVAGTMDISAKFVNGRRITDDKMIAIVTMVYSGINKQLVGLLNSLNQPAVGLCGADGDLLKATKRPVKDIDYGYVGDIKSVELGLPLALLHQGFLPVIAPLSCDDQGRLLNTNADTIATELACALARNGHSVRLLFTMDLPGILYDRQKDNSLIATIDWQLAENLKQSQVISDGMIPKIDNAFAAKKAGAKVVAICSPEALCSQDVKGYSKGTQIV